MAHSTDTDSYDDYGLSPLRQKAFSKSAITRQTKSSAPNEVRSPFNWGWILRLFIGLAILGAGGYAIFYLSQTRPSLATARTQPADTNARADTRPVKSPTSMTAEDSADQAIANMKVEPLHSEGESVQPSTINNKIGAADTAALAPAPSTPQTKVTPEIEPSTQEASTPSIKYYSIVGSYSDYAHALENKKKLKMHTRIMVKDGKYRLVSDSVVSSKPSSYLIDSLRRKRPNDWLAKQQ